MLPQLTVNSPNADRRLTLEEFNRLPSNGDFEHHELLEGELIVVRGVPRIPHQEVCSRIHALLIRQVQEPGHGLVFSNPTGIVLGRDTVVKPDALVALRENYGILEDDCIYGPPDLVVEVLSPGTARHDLVAKRAVYERYGIREYWVVDLKTRTLLQLVLDGGRYRETRHAADAVFRAAFRAEVEVRVADIWPVPR